MYSEENIVVLSDTPGIEEHLEATYDNIVSARARVTFLISHVLLDARAAVVHEGQQAG